MPLPIALQLTDTAAAASSLGGNAGPDLSWMTTVVAVFVVTIAAVAFGFRKLLSGALRTRASQRDLQVLDVLPLGGKRQLAVVRCYDRTFALGLAEKSVGLVAELDAAAVETDRSEETGERAEAFIARLEAAKARLLGVREVVPPIADMPEPPEVRAPELDPAEVRAPRPASAQASGEREPTSPNSTREFIA